MSPAAPRPIGEHPGAPLLQSDGPVWTLTLNRPAEHNRIDPADVDCLLPWLRDAFTVGNPAALVITGNDARSFSSGYTLQAIVENLDSRFEDFLDAIERLPCLTIAAINGNVYGGATDLALCCDIRIGQHGTQMFMPAARIGLHYYPGGLRRYVTRLGLTAANKLMLTGVTIDAAEMLRIGFLTDLVEPEKMSATVDTYTDAAQAAEPTVLGKMKHHMQRIAGAAASEAPGDTDPFHAINQSIADDYRDSVASDELKRRLDQLLKK